MAWVWFASQLKLMQGRNEGSSGWVLTHGHSQAPASPPAGRAAAMLWSPSQCQAAPPAQPSHGYILHIATSNTKVATTHEATQCCMWGACLPSLPQGLSLSPALLPPGCVRTLPAAAASPPPQHPVGQAQSLPHPVALSAPAEHFGHHPASVAQHGPSRSLHSKPVPWRQMHVLAPVSPHQVGAEQGVFGSGRLTRSQPFSCCPWNACLSGMPCPWPLPVSHPGNCL